MIGLLLDTNLLIDKPDFSLLAVPPDEVGVRTSTLCYAELQEGEFSSDPVIAASTVIRLAAVRAALGEGLPFGTPELEAYRAICMAAVGGGRSLTRARRMDMMIAATALANGLTLATRNTGDFAAVAGIVPIVRL